MAERPIAGALKAPEGQPSGGSNPSLAALERSEMSIGQVAVLLAADIAVIVTISVIIGATAPRWPSRWLSSDAGPLHLLSWESVNGYRRLGVAHWSHRLPEWGEVFGGTSKRHLPGTDPVSLRAYRIEVRRAEWVHWLSAVCWLPLVLFNPWWLWLPFAVVVGGVNACFIGILRHNRLRLNRILGGP